MGIKTGLAGQGDCGRRDTQEGHMRISTHPKDKLSVGKSTIEGAQGKKRWWDGKTGSSQQGQWEAVPGPHQEQLRIQGKGVTF